MLLQRRDAPAPRLGRAAARRWTRRFWRCASTRFLAAAPRFGASFKRHKITLCAAEQQRADVAQAGRRWMREQGMFDPARLVFVDETDANTKMVRKPFVAQLSL